MNNAAPETDNGTGNRSPLRSFSDSAARLNGKTGESPYKKSRSVPPSREMSTRTLFYADIGGEFLNVSGASDSGASETLGEPGDVLTFRTPKPDTGAPGPASRLSEALANATLNADNTPIWAGTGDARPPAAKGKGLMALTAASLTGPSPVSVLEVVVPSPCASDMMSPSPGGPHRGDHRGPGGAEMDTPTGSIPGAAGTPQTPAGARFPTGGERECPGTPHRDGRAPRIGRANSLCETKLLATTGLQRSNSIVTPTLFTYEDHFEITRVIGGSASSLVYEARHRIHGTVFALKWARDRFSGPADRERHLHEINAVAGLPAHPNCVQYFRAWQSDGHFWLQLELCAGGSLRGLINATNGPLPAPVVAAVMRDVAAGLAFLHENRIVHLDVKPDNVFIGQGSYKIGDFGLAVLDKKWEWEEGDGQYVAPECLRIEAQPSAAADIFSFGAMLFECATGQRLPRSRSPGHSWVQAVAEMSAPRSFLHLLQKMLDPSPGERPSAVEVMAYAAAGDAEPPCI